MPRPWHRSLTLYLGLLPLLFLLWAWHDSMTHQSLMVTRVNVDTPLVSSISRLHLIHADSGISKEWIRSADPPHTVVRKVRWFTREEAKGSRWFPAPRHLASPISDDLTQHYLFIPHWLITLLYLAFWSLAFIWRHRRIPRSIPPPAQPHPGLKISA